MSVARASVTPQAVEPVGGRPSMHERFSDPPSVTIVIPAVSATAALRACLTSVSSLDPAPDEVVVVSDGGDREVLALARQHGFAAVATDRRSGPAAARNLGAGTTAGSVILFLDSDVTAPPDLVAGVRRRALAHPDSAAFVGSYDDRPEDPGFLSQLKNLMHHRVHQQAREEGFTFWGACGAVRREAFEAVGGFDERYRRPSIEDIELGYRLRRSGSRITVCRELQVRHHKRWTTASLLRTDLLDRAVPWTALILRTGRLADDLNIDRTSRVQVALAGLSVALTTAGLWRPWCFAAAAAAAGGAVLLDLPLIRFLARERGLAFALRALPWLMTYHLVSAAGFALGVGAYLGGIGPSSRAGDGRARQGRRPVTEAR